MITGVMEMITGVIERNISWPGYSFSVLCLCLCVVLHSEYVVKPFA
jgi:hypothetical protein